MEESVINNAIRNNNVIESREQKGHYVYNATNVLVLVVQEETSATADTIAITTSGITEDLCRRFWWLKENAIL